MLNSFFAPKRLPLEVVLSLWRLFDLRILLMFGTLSIQLGCALVHLIQGSSSFCLL